MTRKRLKKLIMSYGLSRNAADIYSYQPNHQEAYDEHMKSREIMGKLAVAYVSRPSPYYPLMFSTMVNPKIPIPVIGLKQSETVSKSLDKHIKRYEVI